MKIKVRLSKEADRFVAELPEKVQAKITYNIKKIEFGAIDEDIFKKLNSNIWEIRTIYYSRCFRLLAFWDTRTETLVYCHTRIREENKQNPKEGD